MTDRRHVVTCNGHALPLASTGVKGEFVAGVRFRAWWPPSALHPTIDFGLVTLARTLGLPERTPLALFALGRTIGWLGHAIEEYGAGRLIRPRAAYVGEPPAPA